MSRVPYDLIRPTKYGRSYSLCHDVGGPFLIPNVSNPYNTFEVVVRKNGFGLGMSIMGGPEAPSPWTNLIRIKKIFPLQPAWETGKLRVGDILLKVNGVPLTGLTLRQALDILRVSSTNTTLSVCRPPDTTLHKDPPNHRSSVVRSYSYNHGGSVEDLDNITDIPNIEVQTTACSDEVMVDATEDVCDKEAMDLLCPNTEYGEFTIVIKKVNGSLGFTVRQTDESTILRHSVKALVKDPAISDGRIRPGDKLVSANGVECANFSHQELVQFLRQCPEEVTLRLYRDASRSQTPVSPDLTKRRTSSEGRVKPLRYEAKEMVRSLQASRTSLDTSSPVGSYASGGGTLQRRLQRHKQRMRPESPVLTAATSMPIIESPLSLTSPDPQSTSLPPVYLSDSEQRFELLRIEDVTGLTEDDLINENSEYVVTTSTPKECQRPTDLDLSDSGRKRTGYVFKSRFFQQDNL